MTPSTRWAIIGAIALATFVAAGAYTVYPVLAFATAATPEDRCPGHERFNGTIWRDPQQVYSKLAPRGCMVHDLLDRASLHGKTRDQVMVILGPATKTDYFREYDLVYWLGPEPGWLSMDSEWLVMKLGPDGRVATVRVVTD